MGEQREAGDPVMISPLEVGRNETTVPEFSRLPLHERGRKLGQYTAPVCKTYHLETHRLTPFKLSAVSVNYVNAED